MLEKDYFSTINTQTQNTLIIVVAQNYMDFEKHFQTGWRNLSFLT